MDDFATYIDKPLVFRLMEEYYVKKLKGRMVRMNYIHGTISSTRTFKYEDFRQKDNELRLTLPDQRLYFFVSEDENGNNRYTLIDVEKRDPNLDRKPQIMTKEKARIDRKKRLVEFFDQNPLELRAVKRFCEIEGAVSIENIRYEIRRMMNCGDIYHVWIEDLYEILVKYGFRVKPLE